MMPMSEMTGKPKRPWKMILPLAGFILLFAIWSAYWFFANSAAQAFVAREREKLARQGANLACDEESWGGFPFRFEFSCKNPVVTLAEGHTLRSGTLLVVAQAYNPTHIIALLDGPTHVRLPQHAAEVINHERLIASAKFRSNVQPQISVAVKNIVHQTWGQVKALQVDTRPVSAMSNEFSMALDGVNVLPPDTPPIVLDRAHVTGTFASEQDIAVTAIATAKADITLNGRGHVSLDPQRRATGQFTLETNDLKGVMAELDPHIHMSDETRAGVGAMLAFMGKKAKVKLSAQDGQLFIGPLKIGELLPVY